MELVKNEKKERINWARFSSSFLIEVTRGNEIFTSSAVAIGPGLILTAAHCVDCADEIVLILGDNYKTPDSVINVNKWIIHQDYNPNKSLYENDLAILFLDDDLPHFINFEMIEEEVSMDKHSLIERIGFGGRSDENIRTWITPDFVGHTFNKKNLVFNDTHSVIGDSGGPIYLEEEGRLKLIGIHSTLEGDSLTYAVNLSKFRDWVLGMVDVENVG